jgi:hypothetical protein
MIDVVIKNLSFHVKINNDRDLTLMEDVMKKVSTYKYVYSPRQRRNIRQLDRVYGLVSPDKKQYRFGIYFLRDFVNILKERHYNTKEYLHVKNEREYKYDKLSLKTNPKYKDRPYQAKVIKGVLEKDDKVTKLVDLKPGEGKASWNKANIRIPGGWKKMEDIKLGDYVISQDGTKTKVTGVFPQGKVLLYKVSFMDGRETIVSGDHLWKVYSRNFSKNRKDSGAYKIISTKDIIDAMEKYSDSKRFYIDLPEPEKYIKDVELPIDPYLLGIILGDACISKDSIRISTPDVFILNKIHNVLEKDYKLRFSGKYSFTLTKGIKGKKNIYANKLRKLGLMGTKSNTKFIPSIYMESSYEQKMELLRGLMDTDGEAIRGGGVSFSSTSKQLVDDVTMLIRSLGGHCHYSGRYTYYTHNNLKQRGQYSYRCNIRVKSPKDFFHLPRKKKIALDKTQYSDNLKLRIEEIKPIFTDEATCISVDHPSRLYITDDYIVTHNTYMSMRILTKLNKKLGIIVKPKYVQKWIGDLQELTDIKPTEIYVVSGGESIHKLIAIVDEIGHNPYKVIIFSNKTMQNYMKDYIAHIFHGEDFQYDIPLDELLPFLGIGNLLNDESHQEFHNLFMLTLFMDAKFLLGLSATLKSEDKRQEQMYNFLFPPGNRVSRTTPKKPHTITKAVSYNIYASKRIKCMRSQGYNHNMFEESIIKNHSYLKDYIDMILYYVETEHVKRIGGKLLVFVASIDFASILTNEVRKKYPKQDVRRYVEDDPYENVIDSDICVTTTLSEKINKY